MATIEAYSQHRYPQESPKTPTYFWITTRLSQTLFFVSWNGRQLDDEDNGQLQQI
jgi:hypothetical protein